MGQLVELEEPRPLPYLSEFGLAPKFESATSNELRVCLQQTPMNERAQSHNDVRIYNALLMNGHGRIQCLYYLP